MHLTLGVQAAARLWCPQVFCQGFDQQLLFWVSWQITKALLPVPLAEFVESPAFISKRCLGQVRVILD